MHFEASLEILRTGQCDGKHSAQVHGQSSVKGSCLWKCVAAQKDPDKNLLAKVWVDFRTEGSKGVV